MEGSCKVVYCKKCKYAGRFDSVMESMSVEIGMCPRCGSGLLKTSGQVESVEGFIGVPEKDWQDLGANLNGVKATKGRLYQVYDEGVYSEFVTVHASDTVTARKLIELYIGKRNLRYKDKGVLTIVK